MGDFAMKYLFGPVTAAFVGQNLVQQRQSQNCLAFDATGSVDLMIRQTDTWESVVKQLPAGWSPDAVVLYLPYTRIPAGLWSATVPIIGLAADWNLCFSHYRLCMPRCDLMLTDAMGVEVMQRAGMTHVRQTNLFGLDANAPLAGD